MKNIFLRGMRGPYCRWAWEIGDAESGSIIITIGLVIMIINNTGCAPFTTDPFTTGPFTTRLVAKGSVIIIIMIVIIVFGICILSISQYGGRLGDKGSQQRGCFRSRKGSELVGEMMIVI